MTPGPRPKADIPTRPALPALALAVLFVVGATTVPVGATIEPLRPDVRVDLDQIAASPVDPAALRAVFRVDNAGSAFARDVVVDVWFDGDYAGRLDLPFALAPGWTTWLSMPWPFTSGAHTVEAFIDPEGRIDESDESNNVDTHPIPADTPDVYIRQLSEPTPIDESGATTVRMTVNSVGTAAMPATDVRILLDGVAQARATVPPLAVGTQATLDVRFFAAPGEYHLGVHVDPEDNVTELFERLNLREMPVVLESAHVADLVASIVPPSLHGLRYGDDASLTFTVSNDGDATAEAARATLTLDGRPIAAFDLSDIRPDDTHAFVVDLPLTPGADDLRLVVDPLGGRDADPANNEASHRLALGFPRLVAHEIVLGGDVPEEGRTTNVTTAFDHNGTLALGGVQAALYDDGRLVANWTLDDVAPHTRISLVHDWAPSAGVHTLRFVVSAPQDAQEQDTSDNEIERDVEVRAATPAACRALDDVPPLAGLRETCRRILLGEDEPLGPA